MFTKRVETNESVTIGRKQFKAAGRQARKLGKTRSRYIESLIDADTQTFNQLLAPVRHAFANSGFTEEQLDQAVREARKAIYSRARPKSGK